MRESTTVTRPSITDPGQLAGSAVDRLDQCIICLNEDAPQGGDECTVNVIPGWAALRPPDNLEYLMHPDEAFELLLTQRRELQIAGVRGEIM